MSSSYGEAGGDSTPDDRTDNEQSGRKLSSQQPLKRTKRRKASRACFHCQKAHLTCDDSRPCQRCIKRGLDESCQDGIRKKAKYLQDVDNARMQALQRQYSEPPESTTSDAWEATTPRMNSVQELKAPAGTVNLASVSKPADGRENSNALFGENLLFDYPPLSSYDFDSKAANLEYSMLSTMLGNVATPGTEHGTSPDHFTFPSPTVNGFHRGMPSRQQTLTPDQRSVHSDSSWNQMPFAGAPVPLSLPLARPAPLIAQNSSPAMPNQQPDPTNGGNLLAPQPHTTPISPSMPGQNHVGQAPTSNQAGTTPVVSTQGYTDPHGQRPTPVARRPFTPGRTEPSSVYKSITKPFSYTNGYHLLNNYIRSRFQKDDLLRIARAIVGYRPSFIALTKTLREEDLTFMEVCFQRTLLEYEKFVGYSGTPTIIWRRTGQIELVGKEFCLLTQWSREQLLSKQTFIVELMDDSSVVEYFEKFSAHAFGDTSSVQTTCVLMTPNRRAVPCAFCFTIKRDVFDIPMMIVGNFLPVL